MNFLLLNLDKTEVLLIGPKHLRQSLTNDVGFHNRLAPASSATVKNTGDSFDQELSFNTHIK